MAVTKDSVQKLYIAYYGRPADQAGLDYWTNRANAEGLNAVVNAFGNSTEATNLYGTLTVQARVNKLYQNMFGRDADVEGLNFYTGKVLDGTYTLATLAKHILDGVNPNVPASKADGDTLAKKLAAANAFTLALDTNAEILKYDDATEVTQGIAYLKDVTSATTDAEIVAKAAAATASLVGTGTSENFVLSTGLDNATANTFFASQTYHNVDGKGPTLNTGDKLVGTAGRTDNSLIITDLTPGVSNNNIPAGVTLSNIQNVVLNSSGNTAAGTGFSTVGYAEVKNLTVTTNGAAADTVTAKNGAEGTVVKATHNGFTGNLTVVGGTDVTATTVGGSVVVGNSATGRVPLATEVATGAVVVNQNFTGGGAVSVFGGTTVDVNTTSTSNSGNINIGNTAGNTGNNTAGAIANASGNINVVTAGTGAVNVFGGDNIVVTSNALSGAGAITVGDVSYRAASNLAKGDVTITETNQIAYNGLAGSSNNNTTNGAISVHGGKNVTITTNGANSIVVGQTSGAAAKENALNPTGNITVTNTGIVTNTANATGIVTITGGADVNVTTTGADVFIGRNVNNNVIDELSNPTGTVTVTQTMNGAGFGRGITISGGTDVTVNAKGQNVTIGNQAKSGPTGAVVVNQADIFTGNNAVRNGTNVGNIDVKGGTTVTVNTTGGNVNVGGVVAGVNTVSSGAVSITNTFGGASSDTVAVQGGTTVDITTSKTSGTITVGASSAVLNTAGTGLKDANLAPTGDVTIVNKTVSGANTAYGTGNVNVNTNGAAKVSITGGDVDTITDIQSTLATGGANSGKAVGTSTLKTVVIDSLQNTDGVAISSDALTDLSLLNIKAQNNTITVTNNTAAHALTITQGGNTAATNTLQVVDAKAGSVTIKDNGTASTATLRVDATKATAVTIDNAAAAKIDLGQVSSDIATVTLKGAGAVDLTTTGNAFGTGNLSKAKNIDASAATGNVTAALQMTTTADEVQTYKGGSAVDTITVNSNASGWSSKAVIDGGNGAADVLVANYAAAGTDVAMGNAANVKGFEVLQLGTAANSAGGNYDASGFATVQLGEVAGNVSVTNAAAGAVLNVLDNTTADRTISFAAANATATNNALTVNAGSGSGTTGKVLTDPATGAITANGFEAITVNSVGIKTTAGAATQGNFVELNGVATNGAATLTVGGASSLTLKSNVGYTSINAAGNTGSTVDVTEAKVSNSGTTFTGGAAKLVAVGSNDAANFKALVTVTGTATNNFANGETAVVTIGRGNDTSIYTYTAVGNQTAATVAARLAAAINANATSNDAAGNVVKTTTGAGINTTNFATVSGGNIVLQNGTAFEVLATETGTNATIADSLLGGQQIDVITVSGAASAANQTLIATINGTAYTFQSVGSDSAAAGATGLAAAITAANIAGISSAVASGDKVIITSQLGQTNLIDESGTWNAGSTIAQSINMTTVNNEFVTGAGGGDYKAGLGGSFNTVTKKFGSGSETVNLAASTAKADTLQLKEGAIVTDNGTKGGVTAFTVGSQSASDVLVFRNAADLGSQAKTILANAVTGVVNTVNNAANMAAVFDSTGALNTKLANLTYTISNGVITFGATGGNSLSQFTVNELINAAQILVSSSTTGGANKVVAFSHNGKSYVVSSDNSNTLGSSTGAGSNTNNTVVELKDVASVKGFGSTFGANTIVSNDVTTLTNATIDLAALATSSTLDYTGFAKATLNVTGDAAASTKTTKFNNLAASAELIVGGGAPSHLGLLETTQVGAAGQNSLTVNVVTNATLNRLTVNGDALVAFKGNGSNLTVNELLDATNTVNTIAVGANSGNTLIQKITGTALANVDTTAATGLVVIGNGNFISTTNFAVTEAIAQNNLKFSLKVDQAATLFTSGTGNTFTQGSATQSGTGVVKMVASGASNVISLSNGNNEIVANGAGNTISVGTGANTIVATGAGDTFNVASGAATTITVGTNATVNIGTANTANGGAEVIKVNAAVSGGDSSTFAKTTISFATGVSATGTVIDFDDAAGVAYSMLGDNGNQVNVASATTLAEALDLAANYTLLVQDQGTDVSAAANLLSANTGAITWFQFGGDTYLVAMVNDTGAAVQQTKLDANDIVVKLVGLHDLTGSSFSNVTEAFTI